MSKKTNMHAAIMLLLSLVIAFLTINFITPPSANSSYNIGFIFGRAFATTLFPLAVTAIPAGIYKLIKKSQMPGFYVLWWILWFLFTALATLGNMLEVSGA